MLTYTGLRQFEDGEPKAGSNDRIFLTFDDGPDPVWTPRVLDALNRLHARATFFVIAPLALRFPHLVRRMTQSGHAVELHCSSHIRHTKLTRAEVEDDAREGLRTLSDLGLLPTLWRTPWGAVAPWTRALANDLGLELVAWTVDTHDWRGGHRVADARSCKT
jgi:peptidoglycan-N-acetylglucosamine deacetylase